LKVPLSLSPCLLLSSRDVCIESRPMQGTMSRIFIFTRRIMSLSKCSE
jgi:anthranilate/para-aminobenzoate synthase component I